VASNLNKVTLIRDRLKTDLGDVVWDVESKDLMNYIRLACFRFYTAKPIEKLHRQEVSLGTTSVDIESLTTTIFGVDADKFYFLGLVYSNYMLQGEEILSGGSNVNPFNVFLFQNLMGYGGPSSLGSCTGGSRISSFNAMTQDALAPLLYATKKDTIMGDESYEWDPIAHKVRITAPAAGSVTMSLAYGYNGISDDISDVPLLGVAYNYLDIVANLVTEEYLKDLIMSRGTVSLASSDFTINIDIMKERYDDIKVQNRENLEKIVSPYILMA